MKVSIHVEAEGALTPESDKLLKAAFARALKELHSLKDFGPCTVIPDEWRKDTTVNEVDVTVTCGGSIPANVEEATRHAKVIMEAANDGDPAP